MTAQKEGVGKMTIEVLDGDLSVCQVRDLSAVDWGQPLCFAEKTDE